MELPSIGKHCAHEGCKQLDFLPFRCDACTKNYCLDHRTYKEHACAAGLAKMSERDDLIQLHDCPLCGTHIAVRAGEDINTKVESHILKGCKTRCCVQVRLSDSDRTQLPYRTGMCVVSCESVCSLSVRRYFRNGGR